MPVGQIITLTHGKNIPITPRDATFNHLDCKKLCHPAHAHSARPSAFLFTYTKKRTGSRAKSMRRMT